MLIQWIVIVIHTFSVSYILPKSSLILRFWCVLHNRSNSIVRINVFLSGDTIFLFVNIYFVFKRYFNVDERKLNILRQRTYVALGENSFYACIFCGNMRSWNISRSDPSFAWNSLASLLQRLIVPETHLVPMP